VTIPRSRDDAPAPVRAGRAAALFEVVAVVAAGYGTQAILRSFGISVGAGALSVVLALALATWLLRWRGTGWRDLGLRRPGNIGAAAAWTLGLLAVDLLLLPPLLTMLASALALPAVQLGALAHVKGDLVSYLLLLIPISWGTAAFGEELLYRGFILQRLGDALGGARSTQAAAAIGQAVLFAMAHAYLGPRGMLNAGVLGLAASVVYRFNGRNLWPLFIAHGLVDSLGVTALYLGLAHPA
jgi:membrane protease YdiL (CAAX protease family)